MTTFADFLFPENIFLDLRATDKLQAFAQIAELLEREHQINRTLIYESLCLREELCSTGLGQGVAIPHAQIAGLLQPIAAFVRLAKPIAFDAPDELPVSEFFVLLLPYRTTYVHLQILADVVGKLCDQKFREKLTVANHPLAIQACFQVCVSR
jgi:PTS system nitrogen regulatory IIA component